MLAISAIRSLVDLLIDGFVVELNLRHSPPDSGKVLLARIETIALRCVVLCGSNLRPSARGTTLDLPRSYSYTTQLKEAYVYLTTHYTFPPCPKTPILQSCMTASLGRWKSVECP